jgi:signal-transduction protein with cAMP-binding, CBS, and nucleotidyltransferase domain
MAHTFVKDIMKTKVISIDSSKSIKDAACMMNDSDVGCVIITKNDTPAGILTERDFVKKIAAKNKDLSTQIYEVMSSPLITINSDETVWEAAEKMKQNGIHKLPVLEDNRVSGIITTTDLVEICSIGSDSSMRNICDQILMRMKNTPSSK